MTTRRAQWVGTAIGAIVLTILSVRSSADSQFIPFPSSPHNILEGNWQSCRETDGRYSERIYDHVVNGVGQFEVHLGPSREFAIFKGVQDEHRAHNSAANLLKPYTVEMENNR